eukprot:CAMPEP_0184413444 /NCGR_PEP_ID=MMETSP0738-20130409/7263_1 /TAXON_ID=385413 /ORGANISM="Thalassiosira miniscula, Strain CCMP1093" /LENGTH=169 /DNA_ID=CAMNT_0026772213 /DNA_START=347 /DNA_END=857 /DNA_ORIENTATION=-
MKGRSTKVIPDVQRQSFLIDQKGHQLFTTSPARKMDQCLSKPIAALEIRPLARQLFQTCHIIGTNCIDYFLINISVTFTKKSSPISMDGFVLHFAPRDDNASFTTSMGFFSGLASLYLSLSGTAEMMTFSHEVDRGLSMEGGAYSSAWTFTGTVKAISSSALDCGAGDG